MFQRFINFANFTKLSSFLVHIEREQPAYGWIPDTYDPRDYDYAFAATSAYKTRSSSVGSIDNSGYFRPISSQLHLPACTANAGADLIEAVDIWDRVQTFEEGGHSPDAVLEKVREEVSDYSRMFLWWNGRNMMDPPQHQDSTSGCYNRLIMDVVSRFGVCKEDLWPYNDESIPPAYRPRSVVRPSLSAFRQARGMMTSSYHAILAQGDERLNQIVKALQATPGVLFGTALIPGFGRAKPDTIIKPSSYTSGRHAMVIVGYSSSKSAFKVRNSWGDEFADEGYCWMHESYIAWHNSRSFWVCTKGVMS